MNPNYLDFDPEDIGKAIFRIVSRDRFLEMLRSKTNSLLKPKKWDDPFENHILNGIAVLADDTQANFGFRDHLYGQCWSFHAETDAMWRIYSPKKDGVKLKTTIPALFSSLYDSCDNFRDISCFIGKVRYLTRSRITEISSTFNPLDSSGREIAKTLLFKREAFEHEQEVRLVYHDIHDENERNRGDVFAYPIDPNSLFKKAILDPRLTEQETQCWVKQFEKEGFTGSVVQSELYKPPERIFINGLS